MKSLIYLPKITDPYKFICVTSNAEYILTYAQKQSSTLHGILKMLMTICFLPILIKKKEVIFLPKSDGIVKNIK